MPNNNIQTDSDSQGPIQPGVGRSDQVGRALHQINPNWVEDGFGIVGPQRPIVPREQPQPHPVRFGIDNSRPVLPGDNTACTPSGPPSSGTWVWGSVEGVCQWIDTTTCP